MITYAEDAQALTSEVEVADFLSSRLYQYATLYCLMVVGEAAKRVSADFRDRTSDLPWQRIAGFRDVAIHNYPDMSLERVWEILQDDVPALLATLRSAMASAEQE